MITKIVGHARMSEMVKKLRGGPQSMLPGAPPKGSGVPNRSGMTPQAPRNYVTPKQAPTQPAKPKLGLGMMASTIGAMNQMKAQPAVTPPAPTAPPVAPASPQQMAAGRAGKASGGEAGVFGVAKRGLGLGNERPKSMGGGKPPKKG